MSFYLLIGALERGDIEEANELLRDPNVLANITHSHNEALRLAVQKGYMEVVENLLKIQAVREETARNNYIGGYVDILGTAAWYGHFRIVEYLLTIKEVREIAAEGANYPLQRAAARGYLNIVNLLLTVERVQNKVFITDNYILYSAAVGGHIETVERLLKEDKVRKAVGLNHKYLPDIIKNKHWLVLFRILQIYHENGRPFPSNADSLFYNFDIEGYRDLNHFFQTYTEQCQALYRYLPSPLVKITYDHLEPVFNAVPKPITFSDQLISRMQSVPALEVAPLPIVPLIADYVGDVEENNNNVLKP